MNFIKIFASFVLTGTLLYIISCKKDVNLPTDALAHVPATSTMVSAINLKRLMEKADFESVKKMEFYKAILEDTDKNSPGINRVLLDPEASGIDLNQKMYMGVEVNPDNPEEVTTYVLLSLKNEEDFARLFKDQSDAITEKDGIRIIGNLAEGGPVLSWNDQLAVLATGNMNRAALIENLVKIYKTDASNSIATHPKLLKTLDSPHDITSWMSTDALAENESAGFALNMIDVNPDALKGNYIYSYGDFEKGKMTGHSDFLITKGLGEDFIGRFFKKEAKTDFSKVVPGEGLFFVTAGAVDLQGIDKFLSERPQSKDYADFVLNDLGMKRKDLLDIFGGDMMMAGYQQAGESSDPEILIATNLKSRKKAQEFLDLAEKEGKLKKMEEGYYKIVSVGNEDFSITMNRGMGKILLQEDLLLFSTRDELLEKVKSGKFEAASSTNTGLWKNFEGQTLAGWFDMSRLNNNLAGFENKWMKDMKFNVNGSGADFLLETTEPDNNSLHTVFKIMNEAYLQRQNREEKTM